LSDYVTEGKKQALKDEIVRYAFLPNYKKQLGPDIYFWKMT